MSKKSRLRDVPSSEFFDGGTKRGNFLKIQQKNNLTKRQKAFLQLIEDDETKIIFLSGPAGTSKTFLSVLAGLQLINSKKIASIYYIRSVIESASRSLGYLPGEASDKMEPYLMPLHDKLEELLLKEDINYLTKEKLIKGTPVNYLRGASISDALIIADEAQNFDKKELITILTRIGEGSKLIVCGDPSQSDINGKSGFAPMCKVFTGEDSEENGVFHVKFGTEDIVRSGILKFILCKLEADYPVLNKN